VKGVVFPELPAYPQKGSPLVIGVSEADTLYGEIKKKTVKSAFALSFLNGKAVDIVR